MLFLKSKLIVLSCEEHCEHLRKMCDEVLKRRMKAEKWKAPQKK